VEDENDYFKKEKPGSSAEENSQKGTPNRSLFFINART
jgi:hypothetical protein